MSEPTDPDVNLSALIPKSLRARLDAIRERTGNPSLGAVVRRVLAAGLEALERADDRVA